MTGLAAERLFDDEFAAGAEYGRGMHAMYENIEWIPAGEAKDAFDHAFVKPEGFSELWRERPYEIFADGAWESGQFDRVVFTGSGEDRRAEIYDFKTNAMRRGETVGAYEARMRETYRSQMSSYRRAVGMLAGIPPERISAKLLLSRSQTRKNNKQRTLVYQAGNCLMDFYFLKNAKMRY